MGTREDRLILFSRYPLPGRTKTRLIPFLGAVGAAELHRHLTERAFRAARSAAGRSGMILEVSFEGGTISGMRRWLGSQARYSEQRFGDLGQRMEAAFRRAFQEGCNRVVLFGTDVPGLSASVLDQAMDRLGDRDVVLGPSRDGGYWLIGLKRPRDLFRDVPWGSGDVLAQTLARIEEKGLSKSLLDPLTDVDTIEDVRRLLPDWDVKPYLSVIIPALNEATDIEAAVRRALCKDVEVLVVDGGSADGTPEAAARAGARVLTSPRGRSVQQNRGGEAAQGRVLLFLHADTLLPSDYVGAVFETLLSRNVVLGAFRFKTDLEKPAARVIEWLVNLRSRHLRLPYGDQGLFLRKEVFERTGGFPEVPIAEDLYFVKHLRRQGRLGLAGACITTSGRRWRKTGFLRTTWINQVVLVGLALRISPQVLSSIYHRKNLVRRGRLCENDLEKNHRRFNHDPLSRHWKRSGRHHGCGRDSEKGQGGGDHDRDG
jgi:rSAM/selenodomain-associated transferase 2/rSAM/selenodomain-associated transferase 1